jgi:Transposase and inactivated derivatives
MARIFPLFSGLSARQSRRMDMPVANPGPGILVEEGSDVPLQGGVFHVSVVTRGRYACFADFHVAWTAVRAFRDPAALGDARLLAWVLLPDRVAWLVQGGEQMPMEKAVSRMKSCSAVQVNKTLFRAGPLWEPGFKARELAPDEDPRAVARRLLVAPLQAGLASELMDYPFWDCVWL